MIPEYLQKQNKYQLNENVVELEECLESYFENELVQDVYCQNCAAKYPHIKQMKLCRLPRVRFKFYFKFEAVWIYLYFDNLYCKYGCDLKNQFLTPGN